MPVFKLLQSNPMITHQLAWIMMCPKDVGTRNKLKIAHSWDIADTLINSGIAEIQDQELYNKRKKERISYTDAFDEIAKQVGNGPSLVGAQLLATLAIDKKIASLNLSREMLDNAYKNKAATSRRRLIYLWKEYESVAHFWAAHQIWISPDALPGRQILDGFPCHPTQVILFLAIAEHLRRCGEKFQSSRTPNGAYLLDQNRTWRVSPSVRIPRLQKNDFYYKSEYKLFSPVLKEHKKYK